MNRSFIILDKVTNQLSRSSSLRNLTLGMVIIGVILRLFQYSLNRPFWLDESCLALNIVNKSFLEFLGPLDYLQVAPIGFLFIEKALVIFLGNNEYILRLFPLFAGIVSLLLFYHVARRCIRAEGALIAISLFSLSGHLIYYSSELKQYSSDVTIALLLLTTALYIRSRGFTNLTAVFFSVVGAIAVWLSLTSVFVLAGVGFSLSLYSLAKKDWGTNNRLIITYFIWLLSFGIFYFVYSRDISINLYNHRISWEGKFMPFPPMSVSDVKWYGITFFKILKNPLGMYLPGLGALVFLLGCVSIFSKDKQLFFILLSPVFFALFASAFHIYPFEGRVVLFIVPFLLLFLGEGVIFLCENITGHFRRIIWIILIGLLLCGPIYGAVTHAINKNGFQMKPYEDTRSVMKYVKEHKKQGDTLYVSFLSTFAFKYYAERYGFGHDDYIEGHYSPNHWNRYLADIQKLRGNKRVWLIFSHIHMLKGGGEFFYIDHLDRLGKRLDTHKSFGAAVYLYDLS